MGQLATKCICGSGGSSVPNSSYKPDTCVSLHPTFKINYGKQQDFKANGDEFYAKTNTEKAMLYYGFSYQLGEGMFEHERATCREGYTDAAGLENHLANIGDTFGKALGLAALEGLECHAGPEDLKILKKHKVLQDCKTVFYELDGKGFRKKAGSFSTMVSLCPYFKIHDGKEEEFRKKVDVFYQKTKTEEGMLNYAFSFTEDGRAHCRESYQDAKGLEAHLANVGQTFGEALQLASLERIECHGPSSEIKILQEHEVLKSVKTVFFELDGKGIQKK